MKKVEKFLWVRYGDNDDYNIVDFDEVAETLALYGVSNELVRCDTYGITDKDLFVNLNYISLYYGDDDAQPIESISDEELKRLNEELKRINSDS